MPNWCSNSLSIYNPKVFKEKCVKNGVFVFSNFIPRPEHMNLYINLGMNESTEDILNKAGVCIENIGKELTNEYFLNQTIDFLYAKSWIEAEEERTGEKRNDWYNWDCGNWGTKWDLADDDVDLSELDECIEEGVQFDICFDTAWSPPEPVLYKMAELGVEFGFSCEEGGMEIYMEGESDGKSFSCWDVEPPKYDEDGNRID